MGILKPFSSEQRVEDVEGRPRSGGPGQGADAAVAATLAEQRVEVTEEDDKRIRRKTDRVILTILVWIYFLQVLDKAVLGTASLFNLQEDTGLTGHQYSLVGSISPIAQLAWQPFSTVLIVKVPHRILMPTLVLGWGIAAACMAACHNFGALLAARFFLGLFEAGCLPLFSVITSQWYRRAEQPVRVAAWNGQNGSATMVASALSYGLGHIPSNLLKPWQIIFLFVGLLTIVSAFPVYWKLDNDIPSARFLTDHEKLQAAERLRANQTGIGTREFKWEQVWEVALDPKSYLWLSLAVLINIGASVTSIFGPLVLSSFGFDKFETSLLNIPFGAVEMIVIFGACYAAHKVRIKFAILVGFLLPVIAGSVMLYVLDRGPSERAALVAAYYLLAFLFAGNPLILAWIVGNTGGATKRSATLALFQAGSSAGNIIGPLLFKSQDAPFYLPGLRAVLAVFVAAIACVFIQLANLILLNRLQARRRVRNGKSAVIEDKSMNATYRAEGKETSPEGVVLGEHAFDDLTDRQNDEFVYIY